MYTGNKTGLCVILWGLTKVGEHFVPETLDFVVEFDLPDLAADKPGYLSMLTYDVNWDYNGIYVNDELIYNLTAYGTRQWGFDHFLIPGQFLKKGTNKFKVTSRNKSGGMDGNIDDITFRDAVLFYPVE